MEANEEIVRRFVEELWNKRKLSTADLIFDPECCTFQLQSGAPAVAVPRSPEAVKAHIAHWLAGFPDLTFAVEQMFSADDRVVSQLAMNGTHTGPWMGLPATGRQVNIKLMTIHRLRAGKIVEDWVIVESLGLLQQLGALPETSEILTEFARRQKTGA